MANFSFFFTDTTGGGGDIGDGRKYTAAEYRMIYWLLWCSGNNDRGVAKGALNDCAVTVLGANSLQVNTGIVLVHGGGRVVETAETKAPASAAAGQTRKDSVVAQMDLNGSGQGQYLVTIYPKAGTAGAYPSMVQTANVWEIELYRYTIDDAGAITGLTDVRQYLRSSVEGDHGALTGLADDDHPQYYNAARHTKAVHDALGIDAATVGGFSAAALMNGVALGFQGVTVLWGGTIGGSDGHRPVSGGSAHEDWHLANGELVNGVQTLDSRNRVPIGAGDTYTVDEVGGATAVDLSHYHAKGGLLIGQEAAHTHAGGTLSAGLAGAHDHDSVKVGATVNAVADHTHTPGTLQIQTGGGGHQHTYSGTTAAEAQDVFAKGTLAQGAPAALHTHTYSGTTPYAEGSHSHALGTFQGATAAGGGHTHTIPLSKTSGAPDHTHSVTGGASGAGSSHVHAITGNTGTAGSVTQSVMQPYRAFYYIVYVG